MQEVTIRLRFTRECLGAVKHRNKRGRIKYVMPRDLSGRVMFLPSMWQKLMEYAAMVASHYGALVPLINWNPALDGIPNPDWQRTMVSARDDPKGRRRYTVHEAFPPGAIIGVNAVLPKGLSIEAFVELLTLAGTYKGVSPFQFPDTSYGTFDVVSVNNTVRGFGPGS